MPCSLPASHTASFQKVLCGFCSKYLGMSDWIWWEGAAFSGLSYATSVDTKIKQLPSAVIVLSVCRFTRDHTIFVSSLDGNLGQISLDGDLLRSTTSFHAANRFAHCGGSSLPLYPVLVITCVLVRICSGVRYPIHSVVDWRISGWRSINFTPSLGRGELVVSIYFSTMALPERTPRQRGAFSPLPGLDWSCVIAR